MCYDPTSTGVPVRLLLLLTTITLLHSGCNPAACRTDAECFKGEICDDVLRECKTGCRSDDDCNSDEICNVTDQCEVGCRTNTDCPEQQFCSSLGECKDGCRTDADCEGDRSCQTSTGQCL